MSTERIILGNNCIFSGNPRETGLNRNVLVVGGTGCGKTVSIVEPALMEALRVTKPNNKIVILTKRETWQINIFLYIKRLDSVCTTLIFPILKMEIVVRTRWHTLNLKRIYLISVMQLLWQMTVRNIVMLTHFGMTVQNSYRERK